ncbi:hypothetical protein [Deinococcus cellulosilyticus]|uniref:Uncharacterized protein n=1 Tax=Deinococcus cellulosilyticus (strain DSM 18568 / NBRC 106333 / KACC 11606 / 5516J-15) TaxID=1223518 RepID=A0A511NB68_DEIC1|nr:hypothetical protein [Deinococcus cellulosilyticus]GEM49768.1 hypothetical protein DC3_54030 [Deinococcus cellulosilyticus NBRC 106333 = KACC 11606]
MTRKLLFFALPLLLTACSNSSSPEKAVQGYLKATFSGDLDTQYQLASAEDRAAWTLEEYKTRQQDADQFRFLVKDSTSKVISKDVDESGGWVTVETTGPDMTTLARDFIGMAFATGLSQDKNTEETLKKFLQEKYKNGVPKTTTTQEYEVVKEEGGWHVRTGWAEQKAKEEREQKAKNLAALAKTAAEKGDIEAAHTYYQESLKQNPGDSMVKYEAERVAEKYQAHQQLLTYKPYLKMEGLKIEMEDYGGFAPEAEPHLRGKIRNTGTETLTDLTLLITYRDKNKQAIGEKERHLVSSYMDRPFKPGFIYDLDENLKYDAPSEADWRYTGVEIASLKY